MITLQTTIAGYTESEFLRLIEEICSANGTEDYQDELLENFIQVSGHPAGSDLIYYPEPGPEATPREILEVIKRWRVANNLPLFRSS